MPGKFGSAEDEVTRPEDGSGQSARFHGLLCGVHRARTRKQAEQGRRHHQHPHHVTEPPFQDCLAVLGSRHPARAKEGGRANQGTHCRADRRRQDDEGQYVPDAVEGDLESGHACQQECGRQGRSRRADANQRGHW
ncbi:hypothetical protein D9M72_257770 [compost metagenome]